MNKRDDDYLAQVRRHLRDSLTFWSNKSKPEREREVVRAFFRCLGVSFAESDLLVGQPEPVDVAALSCRFQVTEVLDACRQRHREYRQRLQDTEAAQSATELREPWSTPVPMSNSELNHTVASRLQNKTAHRDIDALVYMNLRGRFLLPLFEPEPFVDLGPLGWRSVSAVMVPYAVVLHVEAAAPVALRRAVGMPHMRWDRPDGWFEAGE